MSDQNENFAKQEGAQHGRSASHEGFMHLEEGGGAEALAAFFNQPEYEHLEPSRVLQELRDEAPKVKAFILRSGEYFRDI